MTHHVICSCPLHQIGCAPTCKPQNNLQLIIAISNLGIFKLPTCDPTYCPTHSQNQLVLRNLTCYLQLHGLSKWHPSKCHGFSNHCSNSYHAQAFHNDNCGLPIGHWWLLALFRIIVQSCIFPFHYPLGFSCCPHRFEMFNEVLLHSFWP